MITPLGSRYGILSPLGRSVRRAAAGGWWLSGGISAANCVAAYQPKGAADYATSKVNLANPGTFNAADGAAYPTWDASTGWNFASLSSQYLTTGIVFTNNQTWSIIIKISDSSGNKAISLARTGTGTCDFGFYIVSTAQLYFYNGSYKLQSGNYSSGVIAIAGNLTYFNGSALSGTIAAGSGTATVTLPIGCMDDDGAKSLYYSGKIQAYSVYNATLTTPQVAAVSDAMNAL